MSPRRRWSAAVVSVFFAVSGCASESEDAPPSVHEIAEDYRGAELGLRLERGVVRAFEFSGLGCDGPPDPAGVPTCSARLDGPLEVAVSLDEVGRFGWDGGFGLLLEGEVHLDSASGTYVFAAPTGCCQGSGVWSASPLVGPAPGEGDGPQCHAELTGDERAVLGLYGDGAFTPVVSGTVLRAVPGIQGAIMVVASLRLENVSMGALEAELELELPLSGVLGRVRAPGAVFRDDGGAAFVWRDAWLVLMRGEQPLSPVDVGDVNTVDGAPAILRARVSNACGLTLEAEWTGALEYGPPQR